MGKHKGIAALGAGMMTAGLLTACGSSNGITINVYYAPEDNFQTVVDNCSSSQHVP